MHVRSGHAIAPEDGAAKSWKQQQKAHEECLELRLGGRLMLRRRGEGNGQRAGKMKKKRESKRVVVSTRTTRKRNVHFISDNRNCGIDPPGLNYGHYYVTQSALIGQV
ncbi:unnamed protein product [Sphagnum jensenii]|uniref:Uncharacterized protein n=1 Tax=Sphagnum jensenii TaxID=128206 RepID=A0ABP0X7J0_9BRYO